VVRARVGEGKDSSGFAVGGMVVPFRWQAVRKNSKVIINAILFIEVDSI